MTYKQECKAWTLLSVGALAIAGVFALLLVLSRTPVVQDILPWPWKSFFHKGLVTHVVFSFVVWFLGTMGALFAFSMAKQNGEDKQSRSGRWSLGLAAVGCVGLILPAILDWGTAELNNYVPVMNHPLYYGGFVFLMLGLAASALRQIITYPKINGFTCCALIYLIALACFLLAYMYLPDDIAEPTYNERLFWGGGHILQFVNTALLFLTWQILVKQQVLADIVPSRIATAAFFLLLVFAVPGLAIYPFFDVLGQAHRDFYTEMLRFGLPLPSFVFSIGLVLFLLGDKAKGLDAVSRHALWLSLITYNLGGLYGLMLDGTDTRVPAHYHAVIGGINLAFMVFYHRVILPFIHIQPSKSRLFLGQYWFYGMGQVMHASGMFLAGSQGVPRKTAGSAQSLDSIEKMLSMGLMGVGGIIAVIGGVLFVIMTLKWIYQGGRVYEKT